jgi:Na+/glutamate symporter
MIAISYAGLAGATVGLVIAALIYGPIAAAVEQRVRAARVPAAEDHAAFAQDVALLRRGVLAFDILVFGGLGYWVGDAIGGSVI